MADNFLSNTNFEDSVGVKFAKLQRWVKQACTNAGISIGSSDPLLTDIDPKESEGAKWAKLQRWMRLLAENIGSGGSGKYPEVVNFAALPDPSTVSGKIYTVLQTTGIPFYSRKSAGFYVSNGTTWNYLADLADPYFSDNYLQFSDDGDASKKLGFQLSSISSGIERIATWQDKDGVVAFLSDITSVPGPTGPTGPIGPTGPVGATGPAGPGSGNVMGPPSATDSALALWDGTDGKLLKDSPFRVRNWSGVDWLYESDLNSALSLQGQTWRIYTGKITFYAADNDHKLEFEPGTESFSAVKFVGAKQYTETIFSGWMGGAGTPGGDARLMGGTSQTDPAYGGGDGGKVFIDTGKQTDNTGGHEGTRGYISFSTYTAGATPTLTERVRITPDGDVGIDTDSPSEKLEINGSVKATGFVGAWAGDLIDATSISGATQFVATIAALRAKSFTHVQDGQDISLLGHSESYDGGGGAFYVDKLDTTSPDDNGIIVVATDGTRIKRRVFGKYNVKWFGAKGDGVTDDSTAINAAITAAANGGSYNYRPELLFQSGIYLCAHTIILQSFVNYVGVLAHGTNIGLPYSDISTSAGTIIRAKSGIDNGVLIYAAPMAGDWLMEKISLIGTAGVDANVSIGIKIGRSEEVVNEAAINLRDMQIVGCTQAMQLNGVMDSHLDQVHIESCTTGLNVNSGKTQISLSHVEIASCVQSMIIQDNVTADINISNSTFDMLYAGNSGITSSGLSSYDLLVTNCFFNANANSGNSLLLETKSDTSYPKHNASFNNCRFSGPIYIERGSDASGYDTGRINFNSCFFLGQYATTTVNLKEFVTFDNCVFDQTVLTITSAPYTTVTNCRFLGATSGATPLVVGASCSGSIFSNIIFNALTTPFTVSGTGNASLIISGINNSGGGVTDSRMALGTATFPGQIISTLATGTAPFFVASTTQVANLAAETAGDLPSSSVTNWTPSNTNITFSSASGYYTRVGNLVFVAFDVTWPITVDVNNADITGLPFLPNGSVPICGGSVGYTDYNSHIIYVQLYNQTGPIRFYANGSQLSNSQLSGKRIAGSISYIK